MAQFSKSARAEADLDAIWLFIASDNMAAADRVLDRFNDIFQLLAGNPYAGRARSELGREIRSLPVGNYVVFYQPVRNGVRIVRVLHGARDITSDDLS